MGGKSVPPEKRNFSRNRELAAAAGSKGGAALNSQQRALPIQRITTLPAQRAARAGSKKRGRRKASKAEDREP